MGRDKHAKRASSNVGRLVLKKCFRSTTTDGVVD
jgi:hypothetical protein